MPIFLFYFMVPMEYDDACNFMSLYFNYLYCVLFHFFASVCNQYSYCILFVIYLATVCYADTKWYSKVDHRRKRGLRLTKVIDVNQGKSDGEPPPPKKKR